MIHHQVKLLEVEDNGPASEDAQTLVELLRKPAFVKNHYFKEKVVENQLKSLFFKTKK